MRCLFLLDEFEAFRPVAAVLRDLRVECVILRGDSAGRLAFDLDFRAAIVGANAVDSRVLPILRFWRPAPVPVLGVTCLPWMRAELIAAGARDVVVLPDESAHLATAIRALLKQSEH